MHTYRTLLVILPWLSLLIDAKSVSSFVKMQKKNEQPFERRLFTDVSDDEAKLYGVIDDYAIAVVLKIESCSFSLGRTTPLKKIRAHSLVNRLSRHQDGRISHQR